MTTDPRRGLPSASSMHRLVQCHGSFAAAQDAIARNLAPPDNNEDAASGTRIHRWLETECAEDWTMLNHAEQQTAAMCKEQADAIIAAFEAQRGSAEVLKEGRIWMNAFGQTGMIRFADPIGSGQYDVCAYSADHAHALLIDYKTGRGEYDPADSNEQLRTLAALAFGMQGSHLETVSVALVAPWSGKPSVAVYERKDARSLIHWTAHRWSSAKTATHRNAGNWCHHCPARLACDAFRDYNAATLAPLTHDGLPADSQREALFARAYESQAATLAQMGERVKMLEWGAAAIKSAIRKRLEEGGPDADALMAAGWSLKEEGGKREITDPDKAAALLAPLLEGAEGGAQAALMRAAKLSAATLTEEIHKASGKKSKTRYNMTEKQAKDALASALGPLLTQSTRTKLVHGESESKLDEY